MASRRLNTEQFKRGLYVIDKFSTKSKLYDFSNYLYLTSDGETLKITSPIVLGEAISSGMATIEVPYEGEEFSNIAVSKDELKGMERILTGEEEVTLEISGDNHPVVEMRVEENVLLNLATVDSVLPPMFNNNLRMMKNEPLRDFPLEDIKLALKELGKELKGQLVSHNFQGLYLTDLWSFVTNGLQMTGHILPKVLETDIFLPRHAITIINSMPKGEYQYSQKVLGTDPSASPYIYIKGEGIELYFQEWLSKDLYPINQMINFTELEGTGIPIEDMEKVTTWITPKSNLVKFDFQEGKAYSLDKKYQVDIKQQDLPTSIFSKEVLPTKTTLKSFGEAELLENGLLKFNGAVLCRICTPVEESGHE